MLEVNHLKRQYGHFLAVDDVNFSINSGEIVGLLGHNGAGKTTIMKMLSGYLEPNQGQISLNGIALNQQPHLVQQQIGYLPENLPIYPELSIAEYLDYVATLKGLTGASKHQEIKHAVAATELQEKLLAPIATLSRGYKQRVGVAQAILGQPRLLILDEPSNGLDPTQIEHMRTLIKKIAKSATVILSTHILQEVDALCDRVLIINRGRLVVDAKLNELRQSNQLVISSDIPTAQAQTLLKMPGVKDIKVVADNNKQREFQLLIEEGQSQALASAAAKVLVTNNFSVFSLNTLERDLETLFSEVSDGRPQGKAA